MKQFKTLKLVLLITLFAAALPSAALAQPAVSVECAYNAPGTTTDLDCEVWVDTADVLRSGGVLVTYNPSILAYVSADKDPDDVWVFTNDGGTTTYPYMAPEVDEGAGTIVFIVGVLDTTDTAAGITGRAKIGDIEFTRSATPTTGDGTAQAGFFGISAALGRPVPFANFVDTIGTELDSSMTSFTAIVAERGDSNTDGSLTSADMFAVRSKLGGAYDIWSDCNNDGILTSADMFCVRNKL